MLHLFCTFVCLCKKKAHICNVLATNYEYCLTSTFEASFVRCDWIFCFIFSDTFGKYKCIWWMLKKQSLFVLSRPFLLAFKIFIFPRKRFRISCNKPITGYLRFFVVSYFWLYRVLSFLRLGLINRCYLITKDIAEDVIASGDKHHQKIKDSAIMLSTGWLEPCCSQSFACIYGISEYMT